MFKYTKTVTIFRANPLASIINRADGFSIGEAKARHHKTNND